MPQTYYTAMTYRAEWKKYFDENMTALGLEPPKGVFDTFEKTLEVAGLLHVNMQSLGSTATTGELIKATNFKEKLLLYSGIKGLAYLGAIVGSACVAAGRVIGKGTQISDIYFLVHKEGYSFLNAPVFYAKHKEILATDENYRKYYASKARSPYFR